jgi:phage terminase large subunit
VITDPTSINWKNPDYAAIFQARLQALERIRAQPSCVPALKIYYRENLADFISDWGVTFDPRNVERGLPGIIPFVLFEKQIDWINWALAHWHAQKAGLTEKSRDAGVSYLAVALSCGLCLHYDGMAIGFGSRKEEYVDKSGEPKSLFWKARLFLANLPNEFRGGWEEWRDAPHMRIQFPETNSVISGETGDQIGRGDRRAIYIVDEAAHLERPHLVDFSLSQTTNCRIDVSSVNGMNNPFAQKRHSIRPPDENPPFVFVFDWRDDPRKDDVWYQKQVADLDPVVVAQEIDRDYMASVRGVVIPGAWLRSAIDCLAKLGIAPTGKRGLSFDVADEGGDMNAAVETMGVSVERTEARSGKGADIYDTVQWIFRICDGLETESGFVGGYDEFDYDADGLGAGVRGDARVINEQRRARGQRIIKALGFRSSEGVVEPDAIVEGTKGSAGDKGRTNKDFFANHKAQGWWALRHRFLKTHRWVADGIACDPDEIININSGCPNYLKLIAELGQPTFSENAIGKIVINKNPDGQPSPNLADGVMIRFAPKERQPARFSAEVVRQLATAGGPGGRTRATALMTARRRPPR